jgi:hypothetical protein
MAAMADSKRSKPRGVGKTARKKTRETKTDQLVAMLRRPEGATVKQLISLLGWRAHTIRAVISAGLRKSKGLVVTITKGANGEGIYRIAE